ncbi:carbamoyltransferase HypF [Candidatus Methylocalor cossyra]|uniref:Carbamoyltransferase HypF n=1 Tax=Candidatus Methylocalor cossyra TaxID=3108543 RepID=A0ABM9NF98_9GAMM
MIVARHIHLTGRVQGVGFRPFVQRLARALAVTGWVRNRAGTVEILAEGSEAAVEAFCRALVERAPPLARPEPPSVRAAVPGGHLDFVIRDSEPGPPSAVHLPPDQSVCPECLAELGDPTQRRYRYPFINCTQCGPRYTLIARLPYDRANTAMARFELCTQCRDEYQNPLDRRFHAEPLACPKCGPGLLFHGPGEPLVAGNEPALAACIAALRAGAIVAVKGVGGYHLVCDAAREATVRRLRERKRRPHKPLAVLVPWAGDDGLTWVRALAAPDPVERDGLRSPARPIVLLRKRPDAPLAAAIAPGLEEVGLMLPYSPLHHLLADAYAAPLVATSANPSGEPVLTDADEAEARLASVADAFLHHDRPILRPADDSVLRRIAGKLRPLRLGRGAAPLEWDLPWKLEQPLLAVGADLKNTVALAFDHRVVVSPHIGDLGSVRGEQVFTRVALDLAELYGIQPRLLACDAHPEFRSRRWAEQRGLPVHPVLHHHAHASALVAEQGRAGPWLVFTWDGLGVGEGGGLWGGEALWGEPGRWCRVGTLRPFRMLGGDRASREPWRSALSLCWEAGRDWDACPRDRRLLRQIWERRLHCPLTSSAGRLFDAAAALTGVALESSYEGHAAMWLEAVSSPPAEALAVPLYRDGAGLWVIDWGPLLPLLLDGSLDAPTRGARFHASLAEAIAALAQRVRAERKVARVGLTGGVFQNRKLTEHAQGRLEALGFEVILHGILPAGDGGIAFGQAAELAARLRHA